MLSQQEVDAAAAEGASGSGAGSTVGGGSSSTNGAGGSGSGAITAFLVEKEWPGVSFGASERKMGEGMYSCLNNNERCGAATQLFDAVVEQVYMMVFDVCSKPRPVHCLPLSNQQCNAVLLQLQATCTDSNRAFPVLLLLLLLCVVQVGAASRQAQST